MKILIIHGPNLNLLGKREPGIYGKTSIQTIDKTLQTLAKANKPSLEIFQPNHEGEIVTRIQEADGSRRRASVSRCRWAWKRSRTPPAVAYRSLAKHHSTHRRRPVRISSFKALVVSVRSS